MKGKNFTVAQRKILMKNEVSPDDYLLQKQGFIEEGSKRLSQSQNKKEQWTLVHKITGETLRVIIER